MYRIGHNGLLPNKWTGGAHRDLFYNSQINICVRTKRAVPSLPKSVRATVAVFFYICVKKNTYIQFGSWRKQDRLWLHPPSKYEKIIINNPKIQNPNSRSVQPQLLQEIPFNCHTYIYIYIYRYKYCSSSFSHLDIIKFPFGKPWVHSRLSYG